MREGMVHAQEQLARVGKDREGAVASALAEMRGREELSSELYEAQRQLAQTAAALRAERGASARREGGEGRGGAAATVEEDRQRRQLGLDDLEEGVDEETLRSALLQRDQRLLEQGFTIEAHELTIAQLQARLRDQAAYQTLLASAGGGGERPSPPRAGGSTARGRPATASGASGGGASDRVGREEMSAVVSKLEKIIANLQSENADLRKRSVSNLK